MNRPPATSRASLLALMALATAPLAAGCGSGSSSGTSSSPNSSSSASLAGATSPANAKLPPRLLGRLNSAGTVTLTYAAGQPVTTLQSGRYTLSLSIESKRGDFHLVGPMIKRRTRPRFTGIVLWGVHFVKGTYRYLNDKDGKHPAVHVVTVR